MAARLGDAVGVRVLHRADDGRWVLDLESGAPLSRRQDDWAKSQP